MRKNYVLRLGALALAVSLITIGMMGTTLARYAGEVEGTGEVKVAAWNVELNQASNATFNLAETRTTNGNEYVAQDVVAPGDEGELAFSISDTGSQVAYTYSIRLDKTALGDANIVFYSDESRTTPWTDVADVEVKVGAGGTTTLNQTGTIYWKWVDENTVDANTADTAVGAAPPTNASFTVTMSAEQLIAPTAPAP